MQILIPTLSGPRRPVRFGHDKIGNVIATTLEKFASNTAVHTSENGEISYQELGMSASSLVRRFEAIGLQPGDAVIVKLPRSVDLVTVILATQMMGVAFVPVDPSESNQRLDPILRNTNANAIVSQDASGSIHVEHLLTRGVSNSAFSDISYIMHTSGTTGTPKGVPVSQTALLNLVDWYIDMLDLSEGIRISQLTRPTFDLSVPEFFVPFATGGTIVLPATELRGQIMQTIEFLIQSKTNVVQIVPTLLRRFLGALERLPYIVEQLTDLRYVICNGESLPDSLRKRFYSIIPRANLINSYGPTECCVAVSYHYCQRCDADLPMYIGKPACNIDFFVLDSAKSGVGFEVEGELWVGGMQTSKGYVGDDAQSQLRFVPFITSNGEQVLYRTGDYVLASEEQGLRFVGRKDDQIKFRGIRLEKGEITSAIDRTGLCADSAVVVVDRDDDMGQELVCIVTPTSVDVDDVRRRLSDALPNDRVPRLVTPLVELPFTANGKLDQRTLERTAKEALRANVSCAAPQTEHATASPLDHLLRAVHAVTRKWVLPSSIARECNIDSLNFLEIQVKLAETGLMFCDDVYREQDLSLEEWARRIQPVDRSGSQAGARGKSGQAAEFRDELARIIGYIESLTPSTIVLHSSLVALRNVTANEIASILLEGIERVSASSTVILPAFTLSYCATRYFHWTKTKSETGVLADLVMRELPAGRTKHPAYSMVVTGPRAHELCQTEWWRCSPFGDDSIFGLISRLGGLVMGLGTSDATHVHRCELLAHVPYMKTIDIEGVLDFGTGPFNGSSSIYVRDVVGRPEYRFLSRNVARDVHELKEVTREFALGGTYARLVSVRDMESIWVPAMRNEPYGFLWEERRSEAQRAYPMEKLPKNYPTLVNSSDSEASK
ncbi:non-ribosomal peptide synthase [Mesorhizobium australicum WSM2073]|uniref:aminoglycoside N(3)-acetyltransferase n=3 Tax=Mesorhizobium TaxID=68287 RepID=L0KTQ1_MESAW|nr:MULTISPECIES: AMP-binding protein [Mesorhizobium]ADV14822.1 aminoglycoside 3-N-acetyltransferase [Mesorhizobium ciceri biovar biserrulae WSM1271]AEH90712.1 AMP-dependent synthetase and ligase [Mesorhizobium opportunistum WSM2075]AGB48080.1 non-ribosomal peptide synthase [Mesorhizobium australicum WSM2073]OBP92706.1 peptide synthetase [Mesorhizobium loti]